MAAHTSRSALKPASRSARPCSDASKSRTISLPYFRSMSAHASAASFSATPGTSCKTFDTNRPAHPASSSANCRSRPAQTMRDLGVAAQRGTQHRQYRREVDVRCDEHVTCALRVRDGRCAVRGRHQDCLALDDLARELAAASCRDRSPGSASILRSPARRTSAALECLGARDHFVGALERNHGARAVRQRDGDRRRRAQHVDDRDDTTRDVTPVRATPPPNTTSTAHLSRLLAAGRFRARGTWCRPRPAMKRGFCITRARNGIVVVTPSMMKPSSATCIRAIASARSRPWQMSLASSES